MDNLNKKLLSAYIITALILWLIGHVSGIEPVNGLVMFLSTYILIRFVYEGLKNDKVNRLSYFGLIAFQFILVITISSIYSEITSWFKNPTIAYISGFTVISIIGVSPYLLLLKYIRSLSNIQKTRCWYFIISTIITLILGLGLFLLNI